MVSPYNLTQSAVTRQLKAMGCDLFELGLYWRERDIMSLRMWDAKQVISSIAYLRSQNTAGRDIFIRPAGSQGLVFFDDLDRRIINQLELDGLAPAVLIQSSPLNYHGWLRVSNSPIPEDLATAVCKVLAVGYGGDKDSADWRHFGRLAGFTNRKPQYVGGDGKYPFVLLSSSNGRLAERAADLLNDAQAYLVEQEATLAERAKRIQEAAPVPPENLPDPHDFYESQLRGLNRRFGASLDNSRADWMIVTQMVNKGYSRETIEAVLLDLSPAVYKRRKNPAKYLAATLDEAYCTPGA